MCAMGVGQNKSFLFRHVVRNRPISRKVGGFQNGIGQYSKFVKNTEENGLSYRVRRDRNRHQSEKPLTGVQPPKGSSRPKPRFLLELLSLRAHTMETKPRARNGVTAAV